MAAPAQSPPDKARVYARLAQQAGASPNGDWLARIVASWSVGEGALPDRLGLAAAEFGRLRQGYFPDFPLPERAASGRTVDFSRMLEKEDLVRLLEAHADPTVLDSDLFIGILVAACMGSDHLWQDLGLWSRTELTAFLRHNFPTLAEKNIRDMKWKKFLYKQLCEAEGLYLCRAPSCEVCIDQRQCFGPEE